MPTTPLGYPYPAASAPVAQGAADIQALATMLDKERTIEGTTIAAIAAQVGGAAQGRRALLRTATGEHRLALTYDTALGKWVSDAAWYAIHPGIEKSGAGLASAASAGPDPYATVMPAAPYRPLQVAGLLPQFRIGAFCGITFTGGTTNRFLHCCAFGVDTGAPSWNFGGSFIAAPITADTAAAVWVTTGWSPVNAGAPVYDFFSMSYYVTGVGTGTFSWVVRAPSVGVRWVSA